MIKAVIFDFFGVICSDEYWRFVAVDKELRGSFHVLADEVSLGTLSWNDFMAEVAKATGRSIEEVSVMYESEHLDPRMLHLVAKLHKKYKTALLTNAHHEFIDPILERTNAKEYFDAVVVSSRAGAIKPDKKIFDAVLQELGLSASECIFIDDVERYTVAASELGFRAVHFTDYENLIERLDALLS